MSLDEARAELLEAEEASRGRPNISTRQLRVFAAVHREQSITDAADMLLLTQPTVSRTLKTLESRLGTVLFNRTSRGLEPTPAADRLYGHATTALREIDAAIAEIASAGSEPGLRVGASSCLLMLVAPAARSFAERFPGELVHMEFSDAAVVVSELEKGRLDLIVVAALARQIPDGLSAVRIGEIQQALHRQDGAQGSVALPPNGSWERAVVDERVGTQSPMLTVSTAPGAAAKSLLREGYSVHLPIMCATDVSNVDVVGEAYSVGVYSIAPTAVEPGGAASRFLAELVVPHA